MVHRDAQLMRTLHDEHAQILWAYVMRLVAGDRARAEDVVQETMLRAWRNPQVLDQSEGSSRSWLFTVAKRIVIDEWRSTRSRPEVLTEQPPHLAVPDATEASANRALVSQALQRLSVEHRQVLVECYLRGSSTAEAALALGVPQGTVKSRCHYAMLAVKLAMQEIGGER